MMEFMRPALALLQVALQQIAMVAIVVAAAGLSAYTLACALGHAPWLDLSLSFGGVAHPQAGIWVQSAATALLVALTVYLPANARILALETSHRKFHMGMRDVARAYAVAHRADREGAFTLSGEFDSIRERIAFLRDHPDLADLEPPVLELAAQMSHVSRELAQVYSETAVNRARDFLTARQQEIEDFNARLIEAKAAAVEIRRWADQVDLEESVARAQLDRLRAELVSVLPELLPPHAPQPAMPAPDVEAEADAGSVFRLPRAAE